VVVFPCVGLLILLNCRVGVGRVKGCFYGWWVIVMVLNIAFGVTVCGSFRWLLGANSEWMWKRLSVFRWAPFLWQCTIFMILFMGPNECDSSMRCLAKLELLLFL
jgi:hypothetical protein